MLENHELGGENTIAKYKKMAAFVKTCCHNINTVNACARSFWQKLLNCAERAQTQIANQNGNHCHTNALKNTNSINAFCKVILAKFPVVSGTECTSPVHLSI